MSDWDAREGGAHVFVVDDAGRELLGRPVAAETLAQARRLAQRPGEPRIAPLERVAERDYLSFVPAEGRALRHGAPSPWLPILTGILASLGFSALLAWYLSKPVRHLRAAFDAVAAGRRDTRIGALIQAHAELLHRALENVIRNAVKFTDEGTAVEIAIVRTSDPARLVVRVSDRGPVSPKTSCRPSSSLFSAARAGVGPPDSAWAWRSPEGPSKPTADTSVP